MSGLSSIFGALKYIPATAARKALEKVNPKFGNYFASALAYGFDAGRALDYLTSRFESESQREHKENLARGAATNTLRPDEMLSRSEMANAELPGKILKGATALGAGALLGGLPGAASQAISQTQQPQQQLQQQPQQPPEEELPGLKPQQGPQPQSPREQAIRKHAEMTKKKKLIDTLAQEFEQEYGQGNLPATGVLGATQRSPTGERIEQGTPGGAEGILIQALQANEKVLRM